MSDPRIKTNETDGKMELTINSPEELEQVVKQLGLDEPEVETCPVRASEAERQAFEAKNAVFLAFTAGDGTQILRITDQGAYYKGALILESHEFLEAWKEAMAELHRVYAEAREANEAARGPDHRVLLRKYVQQFRDIYGIHGLETDDTALVRDGGFTAAEVAELQEIANETRVVPQGNQNTLLFTQVEPSLWEKLSRRFNRAS